MIYNNEILRVNSAINTKKECYHLTGEQRKQFIINWFNSPAAGQIADDPFLMGEFANKVGLTPEELGIWNKIKFNLEVAK